MVRTSPFHGGNMGSNPVGITNLKRGSLYFLFFRFKSLSTSPLFRADLLSALVTALEIILIDFLSFGRKNAQIYTFAENLSIFSYHLPVYCKTKVFLIGLHILFRNLITLPIISPKLRFTKKIKKVRTIFLKFDLFFCKRRTT